MQCSKLSDYSTTSTARPSNESGTFSPSALAVLRLMTNLTLVVCWTGRSAGLSPFSTRPVRSCPWRARGPSVKLSRSESCRHAADWRPPSRPAPGRGGRKNTGHNAENANVSWAAPEPQASPERGNGPARFSLRARGRHCTCRRRRRRQAYTVRLNGILMSTIAFRMLWMRCRKRFLRSWKPTSSAPPRPAMFQHGFCTEEEMRGNR
jgi:hypothetical protein